MTRAAGDGCPSRPSRLNPPRGAPSLTPEATYGPHLVRHVANHLVHICASFGFAGPAGLREGLGVMLADDDALHGAIHVAFDADGDGIVTASDLATTLSLARPFLGASHAALTAKFARVLRTAGGPHGWRLRDGVPRGMTAQAVYYTPALDAWMQQPVVRVAELLMTRAATEAEAEAEADPKASSTHTTRAPRLEMAKHGLSRREELEGVEGPANPMPSARRAPVPLTTTATTTPAPSSPGADDVAERPSPRRPRGSILKRSQSVGALARGGNPLDRVKAGEARLSFAEAAPGSENEKTPRASVAWVDGEGGAGGEYRAHADQTAGTVSRSRRPSRDSVGKDAAAASRASVADQADAASASGRTSRTESERGQSPLGGGWGVVPRRDRVGDAGDGRDGSARDSTATTRTSMSRRPITLKTLATATVTVMNDKKKKKSAGETHVERMMNTIRATSLDEVHMTMDEIIERKMRQEIVDKQRAALAGKAFTKEWNYVMYEDRIRRITPKLKEVNGINLDQVTFKRYQEEEAMRKTRVSKD